MAVRSVIGNMLHAAAHRGLDGFGITVYSPDAKVWGEYKTTDSVLDVLRDPPEGMHRLFNVLNKSPAYFIFNTRAHVLTEPLSSIERVHPFTYENWKVVHNGLISNDRELFQSFGFKESERVGVDTEIIPRLLTKCTPVQACESLQGGFAFLALRDDPCQLVIARNFKTLYRCVMPGAELFVSEDWMFGGGSLSAETSVTPMPFNSVLSLNAYPDGAGSRQIKSFIPNHKVDLPQLDRKKALVIASGGMDSSTAAFVAKRLQNIDVTLLHLDYGQKARQAEAIAVRNVASMLESEVIYRDMQASRLSPLTGNGIAVPKSRDSQESVKCWVPARNLKMIAEAAEICEERGIGNIIFGATLEESGCYPDNGVSFIDGLNQVLPAATIYGVTIHSAISHLMRWEELALGLTLSVPYHQTCTCDEPEVTMDGWMACGDCGACTARRTAYLKIGEPDPQKYARPLQADYDWVPYAIDNPDRMRRKYQSESIIDLIRQRVLRPKSLISV